MKEISDTTKFQALHSHYNSTFAVTEEAIRKRGKLMKTVLIVLMFSTLFAFWPSEFVETVSQISSKRFGVTLDPDFFVFGSVVGTIIWFILLVTTVEYTKKVVYVERQYEYINTIEKELHKVYGTRSPIFTRETRSYTKKRKDFSKWTRLALTALFPAILVIIVTLNIGSEWLLFLRRGSYLLLLTMNTVMAAYTIIVLVMYVLSINKGSD